MTITEQSSTIVDVSGAGVTNDAIRKAVLADLASYYSRPWCSAVGVQRDAMAAVPGSTPVEVQAILAELVRNGYVEAHKPDGYTFFSITQRGVRRARSIGAIASPPTGPDFNQDFSDLRPPEPETLW